MASTVVELISEDGRPIGTLGKLAAHEAPGQLHRAFSVILFDEAGRVLLQRRSHAKYHFAGKWSNACCSHPQSGKDVVEEAQERLVAELGIGAALEIVGSFRYFAVDDASKLVEREDDTVLVGYVPSSLIVRPNLDEAAETRFVSMRELSGSLSEQGKFTPWLGEALRCAAAAGHPRNFTIGLLGDQGRDDLS